MIVVFSELPTFPDDLSSISGSECDTEDEEDDSSETVPPLAAGCGSSQSNEFMQIKCYKDGISDSFSRDKQYEDSGEKRHDNLRLMAVRHAKVFFENEEGKILSMYRCLLHGKKVSEF